MTIGDYINNIFLVVGSAIVAFLVLKAMWHFVIYVFFGGDDQERAHAKHQLLYTTLTLVFTMIFWGIFSIIGTALNI